MKEKIKRISSSTWALILALMMVVSSFSVLAATTNVNKTGAGASGGTISKGDILYYDFSSLTTKGVNFWDGKNFSYSASFSGTCDNGTWLDNQVVAVTVQADIPFFSDNGLVIAKAAQDSWNTNLKASQVPSDGQNCIKISVNSDGTLSYSWSTYDGGSTKTGHNVYMYGTLNSSYDMWSGFGDNDNLAKTPKFTYDADNNKYVLNNFSFDLSEVKFRIYDATNSSTHYCGSNKVTTLSSGTQASMTTYDTENWDDGDTCFKYTGASGKKVNIEISGDFTTIKVTDAETPTETTPTATTATTTTTPSADLYVIGGYNNDWTTPTKQMPMTKVSGENYYASPIIVSNGEENFFAIWDGNLQYGPAIDRTTVSTSQNDEKTKLNSPRGSKAYMISAGTIPNGTKYQLCTDKTYLWYRLAIDPVATSVTISADATFKSVGDSVKLTANVDGLVSGASNVKYTFTEVKEDGTTVGNPQELSTNTATFTNLTQGTHYYKVTVSADGYSSVTNETNAEVTVTEVVVKREMNAKYQISDTGSKFQDEVADEKIATVNDGLIATGSTGLVRAVNSFKDANGNTYVFSKWFSESGTFANATSKETTFTPKSDGDVIAQYKRQYKVTCTTPTNGTLTASATGPLAGDSYTITVKPADGYELASLMVYLGTPETSGNDITLGVTNGTYTTTAVNNARYVATFSKKKVDYSKYKLIGHFDNNNTWKYENGLTFDGNGECTFTLEGTSSGGEGGNGQFRFSDGTNDYGATTNTDLQMNTEYTPEKGKKFIYYLFTAGAGTYKVTITKIAPNGTPSFKVTKDSTKSKYKLMSSTSQNTAGSSVGDFKTTDDEKVMSMTLSLAEGTYNFYVNDGSKNYCATMNGTLGQAHRLYRKDNDEVGCVQYNLSAGLYTATYTIDSDNSGTLKIDSVAKPLAESVTLSAAQTSVTAGKKTTITATLNNSAVPTGNTYTYKYYDDKRNILATKESQSTSDSIEVTSSKVGTVTYYVTVSTNATYEDPNYEGSKLSYSDVSTSEGTSVSYVAKSYYIAEVNGTTVGDRYALTQEYFKPKSDPVTLSFFNDELAISEDTVEVMTVDESKNKYCQIITSNIEDSAVSTGIPTYKIICNEGAKDPVVYVKNGHIYAVASLDTDATSKTFESDEKVTYYFAEPTWDTTKSNPSNDKDGNAKAGLRIKYWNNSVPTQNGFIDVTTPVASDGTVTENGTKNTIYVKNTDFVGGSGWSGWSSGTQTYYVYKVDLPVWATSFQFVTSGESTMETVNGVVKDISVASMGLNPNRIYMFFENNNTYYARGVVLDSSFWTKTSRENNDVPTKNFKTNAVDYATGYNYAAINNDFNKNLNKLYDSSYSNPLFFGYLDPKTTQVADNKNFRIQDNLAMRINDKAYYASVQGLAGSKLSTTQNNMNGYAYLQTADNASVMPLFDYASLKDKNNVASNVASNVFEKLNFPFNESNYNGVTTYSYDSYTDKNREIDKSKKDFKVTSYKNATVGTDNGVGFFPFEQFTDPSKTNTHKYGFGTEFDIDFYMSETGRLETTDGDGKDITFNFSGDDDVWVYVDGVLVLDLGGAHKASSGLINFSTMEVIYKAAVDSSDNINNRTANPKTSDGYAVDGDYVTTVNLAKLFAANGVEFNNTSSSKKHTLQMFYMERGSVDSNCSISFNLPQNTGLLVRNDVNFDSVNAGLKDITMGIANKDYFSYFIGNKIATNDDFTKLKKTFGDSSVPAPATSTSFNENSFAKSKPQYPVNTTNNVIRRVINGKTYYLAVKHTGDGLLSSYYWNNLKNTSYLPLNDINYSLPDDFAMIEKDSTANDVHKGTTAVSGRVDNGVFNLLFNESASFDSKTPSNTLLQVVQKDNLYNVNAGSETEAMSRGAEQTDRKVKDYYTTSYKITDDKSQKTIGSRERQVNDGEIVADDDSAVQKAFYFADYSADKSDSSAMTVNFTNYVTTDKIKISKDLTDSSKINSDHFTFVVKLSNIFGDSSYADKQEYEGLTYDVYDKKDNTLKTTRTYGKSGVSITANEYAIITGVPVGTSYEVYEKTRSGYEFKNATAAFESDNKDNSTDFAPVISSSTVTGTLPTITASGSSTEPTLHLTYTNEKVAFTISFKYYDREVKTGQVAHIATTPTVKNVSFADISKYKKGSDAEGYYYDFAEMITDAKDKINVDNVIDSYIAFPRQSVAENYIKNQLSYRHFDETTSTYKKYSEAYPDGSNFSAHTDYYGRLQGSKDAKVSDGEDWVTYYNGNKKYATEETALQNTSEVTSITVWYFNTLKSYSPTFHYATAKDDLSQIGSTSKYVANKKTNTIKPVFYNVRLGVANGGSIDEAGSYLDEYGVTGFTNSYSGTSMSIKDNDMELKFLYWSYDEAGKSIASNSYKYGYRVTNNIHLYAIYGDAKDNTAPGLTVSMNSPDYYIDNNGINRVRLNTMMNVYNCPDSDQKIRQVSVIYLQDPNNHISNYIVDNNTEALNNVRDKIKTLINEQCKKESFTGITIKIDGTHDNLAKGLTYKVWNDDGSSLLTNKNRVQFTTSFKQELLGGANYKNLYTFAAMNYKDSDTAKDNWLISDNYIKYTFNEVGKVTNSLAQVNSLQ